MKGNIGLSCSISSITVMDMKSYYLSLCKGLLVTFFFLLAGETDLPVFGIPKITIQCYQGPLNEERWARIQDFEMTELLSKKDKSQIIYP